MLNTYQLFFLYIKLLAHNHPSQLDKYRNEQYYYNNEITNCYPQNPNGSEQSIAGICSNDGRHTQAENFAQLRKVLCMDARSMKDASALGKKEKESQKYKDSNFGPKVA